MFAGEHWTWANMSLSVYIHLLGNVPNLHIVSIYFWKIEPLTYDKKHCITWTAVNWMTKCVVAYLKTEKLVRCRSKCSEFNLLKSQICKVNDSKCFGCIGRRFVVYNNNLLCDMLWMEMQGRIQPNNKFRIHFTISIKLKVKNIIMAPWCVYMFRISNSN